MVKASVRVFEGLDEAAGVLGKERAGKRARARKLLGALEVGQCVLGAELRKEVALSGPNWQGFLEGLGEEFEVDKVLGRVVIRRMK